LLLPDGRLGLIDYGQVKRLTLKERLCYAKLICALAREDRAAIVSTLHSRYVLPFFCIQGWVAAFVADHSLKNAWRK
jgi:hypothetical protein